MKAVFDQQSSSSLPESLRLTPGRGSLQSVAARLLSTLGLVHGRSADPDASRNLFVAGSGISRQQNLRPLELAHRMLVAAHKRAELGALVLAEFDPMAYTHPCLLLVRGPHEQLNRMASVSRPATAFTPKQGQYLAFIYLYTRLHRRPPAKTDMQEYFGVSLPSVHQMVLTLERAGIRRPAA